MDVLRQSNREISIDDRLDIIRINISISVLAGLVCNFAGVLPDSIKYPFYAISILFGYATIFFSLMYNAVNSKTKLYLASWMFVVMYMIIVGVVRISNDKSSFDLGNFLAQDIRYVMYFGIGIILSDKRYFSFFNSLVICLGFLSIIFGIIAIANYRFDYSAILLGSREGIWTISYILWWLSGDVFQYLYPYARIVQKQKVIGYGSLFTYFFFGLLFLKRSSLINSIFIVVITEVVRGKTGYAEKENPENRREGFGFFGLICILLIALILIKIPYTSVLIQQLILRFSSQGGFMEYDRAMEARGYFDSVGLMRTIVGEGIGSYYTTYRKINALHTGMYNTYYKGGIIYSFFVYISISRAFRGFYKARIVNRYYAVCICACSSFALSMLYEGSWTYTFGIMVISAAIAYCINSNAGGDVP